MALVWSLARVGAEVSCEMAFESEVLPTLNALVRLLARVDAKVCCQVAPLCEALTAMAALERALPGVYPLVVLQVGKRRCGIATLGAQVLQFLCLWSLLR